MLFMPDISMVKYGNDNRFTTAVPLSNPDRSGNDKTDDRPTLLTPFTWFTTNLTYTVCWEM